MTNSSIVLNMLFPAVTATETDNPLIKENWTINNKLNKVTIKIYCRFLDNIVKSLQ